MVVHNIAASFTGTGNLKATADVIRVTKPSELAPALAQHEKPVVIENAEIASKFRRVLWWAGVQVVGPWVASALLSGIAHHYGIDAKLVEWSIDLINGIITLTPK